MNESIGTFPTGVVDEASRDSFRFSSIVVDVFGVIAWKEDADARERR